MPLKCTAIVAAVHPCMTKDPSYKGYHLTKGNVSDLRNAPTRSVPMFLEHDPSKRIGSWTKFFHDDSTDMLMAMGEIDPNLPWGAYAVEAVADKVLGEFSISYSSVDDPMETIASDGVRKRNFGEVSLVKTGAFSGTSIVDADIGERNLSIVPSSVDIKEGRHPVLSYHSAYQSGEMPTEMEPLFPADASLLPPPQEPQEEVHLA